jgi:hypothetical protein
VKKGTGRRKRTEKKEEREKKKVVARTEVARTEVARKGKEGRAMVVATIFLSSRVCHIHGTQVHRRNTLA